MLRRLRLTPSLAALGSVAQYTAELARRANLADPDAYRLRLALDELFTNIALHGRDGAGAAEIEVEISGSAMDGRVVVEVTDSCRPFDPVRHEPAGRPPAGPGAGGRDPGDGLGGFGLVLLRQLTDCVDYQRLGGQNRTTIVVLGTGPEPRDAGDGRNQDGADRTDRPGP